MNKQGQGIEQLLKYVMVLAVVVIITLTGMYGYRLVTERFCETELSAFELEFRNVGQSLFLHEQEHRELDAPCKSDEIYFVDMERVESSLFTQPLIKEAIDAGSKDNVFVMRDNKLKDSFHVDDLTMSYPHHACFLPQGNQIDLFIEKNTRGVSIVPGCVQSECTYIPANITDEVARDIIQRFIDFDCEDCPNELAEEFADYQAALEHIKGR